MSLINDQMFAVMLECIFSKKISLHIISKAIGEDLNTAKYVANKMRELEYIFFTADLKDEIPFMSKAEFRNQDRYEKRDVCIFDERSELKEFLR